jgi:hypothetical protein
MLLCLSGNNIRQREIGSFFRRHDIPLKRLTARQNERNSREGDKFRIFTISDCVVSWQRQIVRFAVIGLCGSHALAINVNKL